MKPTIGIIGGCGPLATVDIEHKILKATQHLVGPIVDQDYFNLLVFNHTQFRDRSDTILFNHTTLFDDYLYCAKSLMSIGVNILLIACQTAHIYLPALQKSIDIPIIDIVQETSRYISQISLPINKVGLLSTVATQKQKLYQKALIPYNIEVVTVPFLIQKKLMQAIYIIKTGANLVDGQVKLPNHYYTIMKGAKYSELKKHPYRNVLTKKLFPNPIAIIKEAINYLVSKDCQYVVLGCTELPLILPYINIERINTTLIDPNTIVAESVVSTACKLQEKLRY